MEAGGRDPVDHSDVLAAIRRTQDAGLAELEADLLAQKAQERKVARHQQRMRALREVTDLFRATMAASGNPGICFCPGWQSPPPLGGSFLERLRFQPERMADHEGWPLAACSDRFSGEGARFSGPRTIVLTTDGRWWHGKAPSKEWVPDGSHHLVKRADLTELVEPEGYLPFGAGPAPDTWNRAAGVPIDEAVVGGIANLFVAHDLQWPGS